MKRTEEYTGESAIRARDDARIVAEAAALVIPGAPARTPRARRGDVAGISGATTSSASTYALGPWARRLPPRANPTPRNTMTTMAITTSGTMYVALYVREYTHTLEPSGA